ncbi:MAG: hypothetical protein KAQ83_03380, partial [Nanoarchaeota archaeon]|nr:hypothetical protein [Nanoarchaeota archaeon]
MTEKPEVPKHIAKHKKLYEKGNILLETIKRSTRTSYDAGVEKHLLDKEGNVVMEKLDDVKVQEGFIKTILDSYKKNAKKALGSKKEDAHIDDLVIGAYHGVTSEAVASTIRK